MQTKRKLHNLKDKRAAANKKEYERRATPSDYSRLKYTRRDRSYALNDRFCLF